MCIMYLQGHIRVVLARPLIVDLSDPEPDVLTFTISVRGRGSGRTSTAYPPQCIRGGQASMLNLGQLLANDSGRSVDKSENSLP